MGEGAREGESSKGGNLGQKEDEEDIMKETVCFFTRVDFCYVTS